MLSINEIKSGSQIVVNDDPYVVLNVQHSKMGRAGAVLRTKMKNLKTGNILNKTFQGAEKVDEAEIEEKTGQYLYTDGSNFFFMDTENYEQFEIPSEVIGEQASFLKEEAEIGIIYFQENPINIKLPIKISFKVTEAPPAIKGNTADGGTKQVTLENGIKVNTPLFIKEGDILKVNTETGEYAERIQ
ncbi:MAG: elongation factor P [Patescibacteria group bacterium]|jgi:elongation factor P|nr:elongation factor P [Patescibacteria group bacterium]